MKGGVVVKNDKKLKRRIIATVIIIIFLVATGTFLLFFRLLTDDNSGNHSQISKYVTDEMDENLTILKASADISEQNLQENVANSEDKPDGNADLYEKTESDDTSSEMDINNPYGNISEDNHTSSENSYTGGTGTNNQSPSGSTSNGTPAASGGTSNGGNPASSGSTSNGGNPASSETTTKPDATTETTFQTEPEMIWHEPVYEDVWIEPVYQDVVTPMYEEIYCKVCNQCGARFYAAGETDAHFTAENILNGCGGWHSEYETIYLGDKIDKVLIEEGHWEKRLVQEGYYEQVR